MKLSELFLCESIGSPIPNKLYRVVSEGEFRELILTGFLRPSEFYGRIHASPNPELKYGQRGSFVLEISTSPAHGWREKIGDDLYYVSSSKISINEIEVINRIGGGITDFELVDDMPYMGVDSPVGRVTFSTGNLSDLPVSNPEADIKSLIDDLGPLVVKIEIMGKKGFFYRNQNEWYSCVDDSDLFNDLSDMALLPSVMRKFFT